MQTVTSKWYPALASGTTQFIRKATIYRTVTGTLRSATLTILSGTIQISCLQNPRRTLSITCFDPTGALTPPPIGSSTFLLPYFRNTIKVWAGFRYPTGSEYLVPCGTFIITTAQWTDTGNNVVISIKGTDFFSWLGLAQLVTGVSWPTGTTLITAIQPYLHTPPKNGKMQLMLPSSLTVTGAPFSITSQTTHATVVTMIATAMGAEVFFDVNGTAVLRMQQSPITLTPPYKQILPVVWTLTQGQPGFYKVSRKLTVAGPAYNDWKVAGETNNMTLYSTTQTPNYKATGPVFRVKDTNPNSPTYVNGPYGDMATVDTATGATTQIQVETIAKQNLLMSLGRIDYLSMTVARNPALDVEDLLHVYRPRIGINGNYFAEKITLPLTGTSSMMKVTARWGGTPL